MKSTSMVIILIAIAYRNPVELLTRFRYRTNKLEQAFGVYLLLQTNAEVT